jgi:hypothetical protein
MMAEGDRPRGVRGAIAMGIVVGLSAVLTSAGAAVAVSAPATHASVASTPKLAVTISKTHFKVTGPKTFQAGRVAISLTAVGAERTVEVGSLKKGYTFKDVRADLLAFGEKDGTGKNGSTPASALKHLNRVIDRTNLYGGLDSQPGQTLHGTVVLPTAGTYYLFNDGGNLPTDPTKLTVTGPEVKRAPSGSTATITALTARRFGGAKTLPAKGTVTFKNMSTESPHFLQLIHVKQGVTRNQVFNALTSNSNAPPSFLLKGEAATDSLGKGFSQTLTYNLPKGEYVELCFFPDPKTGMPHALMGMIGIVQLT